MALVQTLQTVGQLRDLPHLCQCQPLLRRAHQADNGETKELCDFIQLSKELTGEATNTFRAGPFSTSVNHADVTAPCQPSALFADDQIAESTSHPVPVEADIPPIGPQEWAGNLMSSTNVGDAVAGPYLRTIQSLRFATLP